MSQPGPRGKFAAPEARRHRPQQVPLDVTDNVFISLRQAAPGARRASLWSLLTCNLFCFTDLINSMRHLSYALKILLRLLITVRLLILFLCEPVIRLQCLQLAAGWHILPCCFPLTSLTVEGTDLCLLPPVPPSTGSSGLDPTFWPNWHATRACPV